MMDSHFFKEQREQSLIKARIVSKYFTAWAKIILSVQKKNPRYSQKMAYIDLFAGPGRYDDQSKSTPLMVLDAILANPDLTNRVVTIFNDKDMENIESLKAVVSQLDGIENLRFPPIYDNIEVGQEIAKMFQEYAGRTIGFIELYEQHSVDKPYIKKNYKDVLRALYDAGSITAINQKGKPPRKGTFSDEMRITFGGA